MIDKEELRQSAQTVSDAWKPIETAPRDGVTIELLGENGKLDIGKWCEWDEHFDRTANDVVNGVTGEFSTERGEGPHTHWRYGKFITVTSSEVMELLDEIDRLRAEIDEIKQFEFPRRVQKVADAWRAQVERLRAENEKLRAENKAMKQQKPVAEVAWAADIPNTIIEIRSLPGYSEKIGDKLYLATGAQTAPSVQKDWNLEAEIHKVAKRHMSKKAQGHFMESIRTMLTAAPGAQTAPSVPEGWQPIETAPKDGTHVLLSNKSGTRVADGMYGNYKVWSWPYVMVEPAYWRPMPAAPNAQENKDE